VNVTCSRRDIADKLFVLVLSNNQEYIDYVYTSIQMSCFFFYFGNFAGDHDIRENDEDPIDRFHPATFCAYPKV
jgi:hypothetical protein